MAVPPGFDVGLGNAGEVGMRPGAANGVGDDGPLQIGATADRAGFERSVDSALDPETVVPVRAAVFICGQEGRGPLRDARAVAGYRGGDAEYLARGRS